MFKSISWQEFILVIAVAAGCYYALIIILFYTKDIAARLKGGPISSRPSTCGKPSLSEKNLMGPIQNTVTPKRPIRETSIAAEEVEITDSINHSTTDQNNLAPADELIHEICSLLEIMREGKPSQESYLKNIKTLLSQYPQLIGSQDYTRVTRTIIEELKTKHDVFLTTEVVEELWPKEILKHSNHSK